MTKIVGSMNTHPPSRVAIIALMMSVLTVVVVIMSTIGFRMELWGYGSSLKILRVAVFGGVTAIVLSIIGIALTWPGRDRHGLVISIAALLIVGPTLVTPLYWNYAKSKLPPIQDISTDLETPPVFWDAPTSRVYPGTAAARQQLAAYPDIQPLTLSNPIGQVFNQAVSLVHERGWKLVAAEFEEGRIEATVTTFWYGFKDDVVIRLTEVDTGVRVDMRSASRFGSGGDGGSNANRIRGFLATLQKQLVQ
jgi:uncharacterized protein (DUF1499 family)